MLSREKVEKSRKKEYFNRLFSNRANINYWQSIYDRQDFLGVCYRRRMYQVLSWLDNLDLYKDSKILDAGCGAGRIAKEIANRRYDVIAMDYSHNMVKEAKAICSVNEELDIKFLQGDIESLPYKDSVFDMVLCLGVITYLKSEQKALREMSRILKPGGTLILSILNKVSLARCLDISVFVKRRLRDIVGNATVPWKKRAEIKKSSCRIKSYFIPSLRNSLRIAGFTELDFTAIRYGPLTFLGRNIFPEGININITTFLEKFSNVPLVRTFGDMCLFKARKLR